MEKQNRFDQSYNNNLESRTKMIQSRKKLIYIENIRNGEVKPLEIEMSKTVKELKKIIEKLFNLNYCLDDSPLRVKAGGMNNGFLIQEKDENKTLFENHFTRECLVLFGKEKNRGGGRSYVKEINIKFIKDEKLADSTYNINNQKVEELYGLLKLCLLKEISSKYNNSQIKQLPDLLSYIMQILQNGYIIDTIAEDDIKKVLEKMKGSNILNFSKYVDTSIDSYQIKILLQFLNKFDLENINAIKNRLLNYN